MLLTRSNLRSRRVLGWFVTWVILIHLGMALGVECCWDGIRDSQYQEMQDRVKKISGRHPDKFLVLCLGSSRTLMALKAEILNDTTHPDSPLVINAALSGSGPMLQMMTLKRLLNHGIYPDMVYLEIMPLALSRRGGAPIEEKQKWTRRFQMGELIELQGYYSQPYRLLYPWLQSRLLPSQTFQKEIQDLFRQKVSTPQSPESELETFGWARCPKSFSPEEIQRLTTASLLDYAGALKDPNLSVGPIKALGDSIAICQEHGISVALVIPPEGSAFRNLAPDVRMIHLQAIKELAKERKIPLIDGSDWIDDVGFWDGHHATEAGAEQYTRRFAKEALANNPRLIRNNNQAFLSGPGR